MASPNDDMTIQTREGTCEKHGTFVSRRFFRSVWSRCGQCGELEEAAERVQKRADEVRVRVNGRLDISGLRGRFADATFANYESTTPEQTRVLTACRAYTEAMHAASGSLWLVGPPGTGKTHLGAAMVNDLIRERDTEAMLMTGREIIRRLRATWARDAVETEQDVLHAFGQVPLLVLDEIGVGFGSEAEHAQLLEVVDERYILNKPTVLLSNLQPEGIKQAIGHRAYDRLREGAKFLLCNWASRRG